MATSGTVDLRLLSFDKTTGIFSQIGTLSNGLYGGYSTAFSPDGSKLYAGSILLQYDLSLLPNMTAVQNSLTVIDTTSNIKLFMRNGPDGKIYILPLTSDLGCIQNPNAAGAACLYDGAAMTLPNYNSGVYSELGNVFIVHEKDTTIRPAKDTTVCQANQLRLKAPADAESYLWSTGSQDNQADVSQDGSYWLYSSSRCSLDIDSFHVRFVHFSTDLGPDTTLCQGDSLRLDATVAGATYRWQDGSTAPGLTVSRKGRYAVTATVAGCSLSDSILIDVTAPYADLLENDTTICSDAALVLHTKANPTSTFTWNDGSNGPDKTINKAGTYTVTAENICGTFSDSLRVETMYCNCTPYAPNAFSPNGDGKNDVFVIELHCPAITAYEHTIYNRFGQRVFESKTPGIFWDGAFNGAACDAGTYFYYITYKNGPEKIVKKGDLVLIR